jgi:drug/metabolite transporter (DMT)-like permease
MRRWTMFAVGGLNILFFVAGVWYSAAMLSRPWHPLNELRSIGAWATFLVLITISTGLAACLAYLGIRLLKGDEAAIRYTTITFATEILFVLVYVVLFWLVLPIQWPDWPGRTAHFLGVIPLDPQIATGYPVLGLIVMALLRPGKRSGTPRA